MHTPAGPSLGTLAAQVHAPPLIAGTPEPIHECRHGQVLECPLAAPCFNLYLSGLDTCNGHSSNRVQCASQEGPMLARAVIPPHVSKPYDGHATASAHSQFSSPCPQSILIEP